MNNSNDTAKTMDEQQLSWTSPGKVDARYAVYGLLGGFFGTILFYNFFTFMMNF